MFQVLCFLAFSLLFQRELLREHMSYLDITFRLHSEMNEGFKHIEIMSLMKTCIHYHSFAYLSMLSLENFT